MSPDYSPDVLEMLGMELISQADFQRCGIDLTECVLFRKIDLTSFGPYHEYRIEWWPKDDVHPKFHVSTFFTDKSGVAPNWRQKLTQELTIALDEYVTQMDLIPSKG
jgi:hypothetical protein